MGSNKCAKEKFSDSASAKKAMARLNGKGPRKSADKWFEAYQCPICSEPGSPVWHHGHTKRYKRRPVG